MAEKVSFTTIKANSDNKRLEQDSDGYYYVTLGAVNIKNTAGAVYLENGLEEMLSDGESLIGRRLKNGNLRTEVDHPSMEPGMSKQEFLIRNLRVVMNNACGHIKEIVLVKTNENIGIPGIGNIILIEGWIKPSGVKGDALKASLDNPEENTTFSIRSFTNDFVKGGVLFKRFTQIATFDWVTEPGIHKASKWNKLSIESAEVVSFNVDELGTEDELKECINCSIEDKETEDAVKEIISRTKQTSIVDKW